MHCLCQLLCLYVCMCVAEKQTAKLCPLRKKPYINAVHYHFRNISLNGHGDTGTIIAVFMLCFPVQSAGFSHLHVIAQMSLLLH